MNEQLKALLTGLGAMAELSKAAYDAFVKAGFKEEQALFLSAELMKTSLMLSKDKDQEE